MSIYLIRIAALIGLAAFCLPGTNSSPYIISDDRIRSLDITPVLGRGYSIMTNTFQSNCLNVKEATVPSYNYNYEFFDMIEARQDDVTTTTTETVETVRTSKVTDITTKVSYSFSYHYVRYYYYSYRYGYRSYNYYSYRRHRNVRTTSSSSSSSSSSTDTSTTVDRSVVNKNKHMVVSVMRLERYYSSVRDELSTLSTDAVTILDAQDYVGFFKACGPNYVRGIRRAQEVTGIFSFESENVEKARSFAKTLRGNHATAPPTDEHKLSQTSLRIEIIGYGLGLGVVGGTLVPTNLVEYQETMKFAFRAMTQSRDSLSIGQVYGIEVVPWIDSTAFQVAARVLDEVITIPLPRSLIPAAISTNLTIVTFANDVVTRLQFRCRDTANVIDKYGNCCELNALYHYPTGTYNITDPNNQVCRPLRVLDSNILKNNMAANGEFVARLDEAVRYKINQLATLQQCISAANAIPERFNYNILKAVRATKESDAATAVEFTVLELRLALDPFNDYRFVTHMAKELDEFVEMFYSPCLAALFGSNMGDNSNTDPTNFMAYPWHAHEECLYMSCFADGMRWDRVNGGCTPGLITGSTATAYSDTEPLCTKNSELAGNTEVCKHNSTVLFDFHRDATSCWTKILPSGSISYFLDNHCMPEVVQQEVNPGVQTALEYGQASSCGKTLAQDAKTLPFKLNNKRTKFRVYVPRGLCLDGRSVEMAFDNTNSAGGEFEYNFATKTINLVGCSGFSLTIDDCAEAGSLKLKRDDNNPDTTKQWTFNSDGTISSDCGDGQYYLATTGDGYHSSPLGLASTIKWEATWDMTFSEQDT